MRPFAPADDAGARQRVCRRCVTTLGDTTIEAHERDGCPGNTPMARSAGRALINLWPVHEYIVPGAVRYADLVTSTWDARAALMLALGRTPESGTA